VLQHDTIMAVTTIREPRAYMGPAIQLLCLRCVGAAIVPPENFVFNMSPGYARGVCVPSKRCWHSYGELLTLPADRNLDL
jgi:hypothetical protein